ncbi:MAG: PilZ domain-containing protein [bacterium]|nr:PilZ domain-containing protein [bacterium]
MSERRKYVRVPINMIIEVRTSKALLNRGLARVRDISLGGMAIETELKLWKGSKVFLTISIPMQILGSVVYEKSTNLTGVNSYGIKFEKLGFFNRINLKRFITARLSKIKNE